MFEDVAEDLSEHLAEGRALQLALMVDTCRITKPGEGEPVLNDDLQYERPPAVLVYEGPCYLQIKADINSNVVEITAGEREWSYQTLTLHIPVITPADAVGNPADARVDHTVEYLTAAEDPELVGRLFQIRALHHKTRATARRLRVTEGVV